MARPSKLRVAVSDPAQWLSERERAQMLAPKLRALADETRLTLILLIAQRPRTVKELQEATGLSQTLVSHHLAPLREQNLVEAIPKGRSNQYVMCCQTLAEPLRMFASLAAMDPETVAACLQTEADQPLRHEARYCCRLLWKRSRMSRVPSALVARGGIVPVRGSVLMQIRCGPEAAWARSIAACTASSRSQTTAPA